MLWTAWLPANGERVTLNKLLKLKEGYKGRIQQKKEWERGVYIESHDDEFRIYVECLVERGKRVDVLYGIQRKRIHMYNR